MKKNVFFVLRLALTLLVITSLVAAALAGVNAVTEDRIAEREREKTRQALSEVLPEDAVYQSGSGLLSSKNMDGWLEQEGAQIPDTVKSLYTAHRRAPTDDISGPGNVVAFAVELVVPGFNGEITMMVGVDTEGKVLGISVISHSETAGLGAEAASNSTKGRTFREQFIGAGGELAVTKDGGTVDAISGATITSRAVTEGVDTALWLVDLMLRHTGL